MINIITTEQIDTEKQYVFITLDVDGETIEQTTVQPWNTKEPLLSGQALVDWIKTQEDRYKLEILKDMYPGAEPDLKTVESFETWVKGGAEKTDKGGKKEQVIKKAWTNKHPKRIGLKARINEAKSISDLKTILLDIV